MGWTIDRDYLAEPDTAQDDPNPVPSRAGTEGAITVDGGPLPDKDENGVEYPKVRFRLSDDDREVYYGGWLHDDPGCENQESALSYGTYDAGAVIIEVKRNGEWEMDLA
jgi:hypothetical protein